MSHTKKQDFNTFNLKKEIKEYIKSKLNIKEEHFELIYGFYQNDVRNEIRKNFLAHYVKALEIKLREYTGNPFFNIIIKPLPKSSTNLNVGVGQYHHKRFVIIYYHPNMEENNLRDCLAHEIGHVFLCTLLRENVAPKSYDTEPLASLLGILYMIDDSDFYSNRCKIYGNRKENKIVDDFIFITDRKKELKNKKKTS